VGGAVTMLLDVALPHRRAAERRALPVGGTVGIETVAELCDVAFARRAPAERAGIRGAVPAVVAGAVAHVARARAAVIRARRAGRLLRIVRACRARSGASFRHVALAGCRATDRRRRLEAIP